MSADAICPRQAFLALIDRESADAYGLLPTAREVLLKPGDLLEPLGGDLYELQRDGAAMCRVRLSVHELELCTTPPLQGGEA